MVGQPDICLLWIHQQQKGLSDQLWVNVAVHMHVALEKSINPLRRVT